MIQKDGVSVSCDDCEWFADNGKCREEVHVNIDVISGYEEHYYATAIQARRDEKLCGFDGKRFKPKRLFRNKSKGVVMAMDNQKLCKDCQHLTWLKKCRISRYTEIDIVSGKVKVRYWKAERFRAVGCPCGHHAAYFKPKRS